jgi:hypothetical protein
MNNILNLKKRVMARIYVEYAKNILLGYPDYFMLLVFMVSTFMLVSIHDVLNNIPKNNLSGDFNFFVVALQNTSWIIQALIIGFLIRVVIAGSRLTYKNIKNSHINMGWIMTKLKY